jgi:O-antigen ligase
MFILSTAAIILFGEIQAALQLAADCGPGKFWPNRAAVFSDPAFTYHFRTKFEEHTSLHPTYASIFLGISILLILDYFLKSFNQKAIRSRALILAVIILFVFLQSLLASRTPFIATMLCSVVLIFIYLKRKIYALYVLGALIVLSVLLTFMIPSFSSRFREISFSNTSVPSATNENSFNIRVGIYQCSRDIISENWLWGVGPGNVQDKLNDCYSGISKEVYDQKNYNTHNQFMDYWAGLGILGPVSLIIILLYTSIRNYRIKNPLALCISLLFIIAMMTENLLSRQNGIVCFAYFTSLYFFSPRKGE